MGITITPSAVVYDFSSEEEYGVLLEGSEELKVFHLSLAQRQSLIHFYKVHNPYKHQNFP